MNWSEKKENSGEHAPTFLQGHVFGFLPEEEHFEIGYQCSILTPP